MVQLDPVAGEACHEQRTVQAQRARCESTGSLLGVSAGFWHLLQHWSLLLRQLSLEDE